MCTDTVVVSCTLVLSYVVTCISWRQRIIVRVFWSMLQTICRDNSINNSGILKAARYWTIYFFNFALKTYKMVRILFFILNKTSSPYEKFSLNFRPKMLIYRQVKINEKHKNPWNLINLAAKRVELVKHLYFVKPDISSKCNISHFRK